MAGKSFELAAYAPLALGGFLVIACCGLLAWPVARIFNIQTKTLVPPMIFNNSGNIAHHWPYWLGVRRRYPLLLFCLWLRTHYTFPLAQSCLIPKTKILSLWRTPVVLPQLPVDRSIVKK